MKILNYKTLIFCLALLAVTQHVSADESRSEFDFFDQNRNGAITFDEFFVVMMHKQARNISFEFSQADRDRSHTITFEEAGIFDISFDEYDQADKDQSSEVDLQEFFSATMNTAFKDADLNHNNTVDFLEFQQVKNNDS
jgi:hypothetical protein